MADPKPKQEPKKGQEKKTPLELSYSTDIKLENGLYRIGLKVIALNPKNALVDTEFRVHNQKLEEIYHGTTANGKCNFVYEFDATLFAKSDKPTIELRAEADIEGKFVTSPRVKIELPPAKKSGKISFLKRSDPWIEKGKLFVLLEVMVVDDKGKPIKGEGVTFSDNFSKNPYCTAITDDSGKAFFKYHASPGKLNTRKQIRAFLTGNPSELKELDVLLTTNSHRGNSVMGQARFNATYWRADIIKHIIFQLMVFLPAAIGLIFFPEIAGALLSITIGFLWFVLSVNKGQKNQDAKTVKRGIIYSVAISALGVIFSPAISGFLAQSIIWSFAVGMFYFFTEKLTQRLEFKKEGPAEFKKFADFHPWWGVTTLAILACVCLLIFAIETFGFFHADDMDNVSLNVGTVITISETKEVASLTPYWIGKSLMFVLALIILVLTNAYQDIKEKLVSKLGDLSPMRIIEHGLFVKEAADILRGRGGKKQ